MDKVSQHERHFCYRGGESQTTRRGATIFVSEFDFDVRREMKENGGRRKAEEEVVSIVHVYDLLTLSVQYISDSSPKKQQSSV